MLRVVAGGTDLARLVGCRATRRITRDDVRAMERAAAVAALLITREQAVSAVERSTAATSCATCSSVAAATTPTSSSTRRVLRLGPRPAAGRGRAAEIDPAPADAAGVGPAAGSGRSASRRLAAVTAGSRRASRAPTSPPRWSACCPSCGRDHLAPRRTAGGQGVAGDKGGGRRPFAVGVSRVISSLGELPDAYAQSRRALEIGSRSTAAARPRSSTSSACTACSRWCPTPLELREFAHDVLGTSPAHQEAARPARRCRC